MLDMGKSLFDESASEGVNKLTVKQVVVLNEFVNMQQRNRQRLLKISLINFGHIGCEFLRLHILVILLKHTKQQL